MADRPARRYPFIVLEGTDGSGKSTIRTLLHDRFNAAGLGCFMVGQHSWLDVRAGRIIQAARTQQTGLGRRELMHAYARDKILHVRHNILPALDTVAVIADRYYYSDAVYHDVLYGIPVGETLGHHRRQGTPVPDVVVFVDTDPDIALQRAITRGKSLRAHENEPTLRRLHELYTEVFTSDRYLSPSTNIIHARNNGDDPEACLAEFVPQLESLFPSGPVDRPAVSSHA